MTVSHSRLPPDANETLHHDYVLILEMLDPDEDLTGTLLAEQIEPCIRLPIRHRTCANEADLIAALREAQACVPERGYPIVHLEAHGVKRENAASPGGIALDHQGNGFVSWHPVWNALRALNVATDFNLLVVAAACFGDDVIYGLAQNPQERVLPVPFIATVGFEEKVKSVALLDAMSAFYEALGEGSSLSGAVQAANNMLASTERLTLRWAVEQLADAILAFEQGSRDGSNADYYWRRYLEFRPGTPQTQKEKIVAEIRSHERGILKHLLPGWLAFDTHPHNRTRFRFPFLEPGHRLST